jgi:hypothetical protein
MVLWNCKTPQFIVLIRKRRYKSVSPLEFAPCCATGNLYGAICRNDCAVNLTKVFQFHFQFQVRVRIHVLVRVLVRVLVLILVRVRIFVASLSVSCPINMALWIFLSDTAIADSQGSYEVVQKLIGPLSWDSMGEISWKSQRLFL